MGDSGWLGFCQLKGGIWGAADLFAALAPPSLPSHRRVCCCSGRRERASLPSDFMPHVVTPMWAGGSLVTVAGDVVPQCRFVVAGVVHVRLLVVERRSQEAVVVGGSGDAAEVGG